MRRIVSKTTRWRMMEVKREEKEGRPEGNRKGRGCSTSATKLTVELFYVTGIINIKIKMRKIVLSFILQADCRMLGNEFKYEISNNKQ